MARTDKKEQFKIYLIMIAGILVICGIIILLAAIFNPSYTIKDSIKSSERVYECDYKTVSLNTSISYLKDDATYTVKGDIFHLLTDPLTLYKDDKVIGEASDAYHIIGQDDHAIIINGKFEIDVVGNIELLGENYDLYNQDGIKVGYADFNSFGTSGAIYNIHDEVIATFSKFVLFNDYTIKIYDNNLCSDNALLMIFASYMSDYKADHS